MRCLTGVVAVAAVLAMPVDATDSVEQCSRATLPAYAHNDYANAQPLTDALRLGFRGIEADVYLMNGVLRVGHDRRQAGAGRTLEELYLQPLSTMIARCGSITGDERPFLLAIEIKESSTPTYMALDELLGRYRDRLTGSDMEHGRAPVVQPVLVGWHPGAAPVAGSLMGIQHRLTRLTLSGLPELDERVWLLSLDYGKTIGRWWVSSAERRRWLAMLRAVKEAEPGRILRVHNVPTDGRIYAELLNAGVDLIGTKDLAATRQLLSAIATP